MSISISIYLYIYIYIYIHLQLGYDIAFIIITIISIIILIQYYHVLYISIHYCKQLQFGHPEIRAKTPQPRHLREALGQRRMRICHDFVQR